jgi:hypothetical protein
MTVAPGMSRTRRQVAREEQEMAADPHSDEVLASVAKKCLEHEVIELQDYYGHHRKLDLVPDIITRRLGSLLGRLGRATHPLTDEVARRCDSFASSQEAFAQVLDEEQERELQQELDEQRQVENPGQIVKHEPVLSAEVRRLAAEGVFEEGGFLPIAKTLEHTQVGLLQRGNDGWSPRLWASKEFAKTVIGGTEHAHHDLYLRPPRWVIEIVNLHVSEEGTPMLVLISPFEANLVLHYFRANASSDGVRLRLWSPANSPYQSSLYYTPCMVVPAIPSASLVPVTAEAALDVANLTAFSGGLFFASPEEEESYRLFLGLSLHPRSQAEQQAYDDYPEPKQRIQRADGFVLPAFRGQLGLGLCGFSKSPVALVSELLTLRGHHGDVGPTQHFYTFTRCDMHRFLRFTHWQWRVQTWG